MEITITLLVLSLISVLWILWNKTRRRKEWPPGPPTLPFVGNLNINLKDMIGECRKFRQHYGDVFSLIIGCKTVVVVNGSDTIKELLVKHGDVVSERPNIVAFNDIVKCEGIVPSSGDLWKVHREFAFSTLRDFGFGKRSIEGKIIEEVEVLVQCLKEIKGKPLKIDDQLHTSISNIICSIAFGDRYEHDDENFIALADSVADFFRINVLNGIMTFFPFLKYIPGDPGGYFKAKKLFEKIARHINPIIDEHKRAPHTDVATNYLDAFLKHQREHNDQCSTFTDSQLERNLSDLFIAGVENMTTALKWFILIMLHKPDVQERMRREILEVIGDSRFPALKDREHLPFCDAVLHETLRFGNLIPLGTPHGLTRYLQFRGYTIPKDAMIIPFFDSILNDPNVYPNPSEFLPSRFLTENGSLIGTDKVLIGTFGIGRRMCLGESLARSEFFLFTTSLIQRFKLLKADNEEIPSLSDYTLGISRSPLPYKMRAVETGY